MKKGFTLAEVLITLGIIGVVAALTLPALIQKYQKHVWYTQFRKAATVIENAINRYNQDHACGTVQNDVVDNLCINTNNSKSVALRLGEYMNVAKWFTSEDECNGYKEGMAMYYDGADRDPEYVTPCTNDSTYSGEYAFITNDGMLINTALDLGIGSGSVVDVNGFKGPNILGRDIFVFYLYLPVKNRWGFPENDSSGLGEYCRGDDKSGDFCGIRLLEEGKMNY